MRALFVCIPELGHVHPLFPLAHALADAGHEVGFASGDTVRERIEREGFGCDAVRPSGPDEMFGALVERVGPDPGAGLAPEAVIDWFTPNLFGETVGPMMLPGLLAVAERWASDLIVHDMVAFAAPLVAAVVGVPSVQHSLGLLLATGL